MPELNLQPGPVTLYAQLAAALRAKILGGVWPTGREIPTLEELAAEYDVARVTARQAVQMLSNDGLLSSHRGRRTIVTYEPSAAPVTWSIGSVERDSTSFTLDILSRDELDSSSVPAHDAFFGKLAGKYTYIKTVDKADGLPYAVSSHYVSSPVFRKFPQGAELHIKISRLVKEHTSKNVIWRERVTIGTADYIEAGLLDCALSAPVARVARICASASQQILYLSVLAYVGAHYLTERDITALMTE